MKSGRSSNTLFTRNKNANAANAQTSGIKNSRRTYLKINGDTRSRFFPASDIGKSSRADAYVRFFANFTFTMRKPVRISGIVRPKLARMTQFTRKNGMSRRLNRK